MSALIFSIDTLIIFALLMLYIFAGTFVETKKPIFGHEAGLVILVGVIISYFVKSSNHVDLAELLTFEPDFFFYFCLPPIIFASGYNMKRKKFFENFTNILMFGLFGTILQFCIFSILTYLVL